MRGNIFNETFLQDVIRSQQVKLEREIDRQEITASTDLATLIEKLKNKFLITPITIKNPIPSEPVETTIEQTNNYGGFYDRKVYKINLQIPFEGDGDLFRCYASNSTIVYLRNEIRILASVIATTIILDDLDLAKYEREVNKLIGDLKVNLPNIHAEIGPWNDKVEALVKDLLEKRKGVVAKKYDFMEKIGLSVNPKSNDFMVPTRIAKKTIPTPITQSTKVEKKEKVPSLQEEVYKDIKEVLFNVGQAIERKPSLYIGKHEEDLRDVFLLFLETRYQATSGVGEAFNKKGKTDILLKYAPDGSNIFVAECKVWKGQKKFLEAIDQLLGYLTHRDSKTALMLFVDQMEFSTIIQSVKQEIKNHSNFKRHIKDTYESSLAFEFSLPGDSNKIIQIEVMLFHFPKIK